MKIARGHEQKEDLFIYGGFTKILGENFSAGKQDWLAFSPLKVLGNRLALAVYLHTVSWRVVRVFTIFFSMPCATKFIRSRQACIAVEVRGS